MNINDFPKSKEKLKGFVKQNLLKFQEATSEAAKEALIPEITDEMVDQYIQVILLVQSRNLYDFFDMNKIFINIIYQFGHFTWNSTTEVDGKGIEYTDVTEYSFRAEAEWKAFEQAFKEMEGQL